VDTTRSLNILALVAISIAVALPASASANLRAIDIFEDFVDSPVDATSVKMCWAGDHTAEADSWTIRRAAGATPPPADAPAEATIPGGTQTVCYTAAGLVTEAAYTFRITGHDAGGESEPGIFTVAARDAGSFVLSGGSSEKLPGSVDQGSPKVAVTTRDRRWHALYWRVNVPSNGYWLYHSTRSKTGWTAPELLGTAHTVQDDWLVANGGSLMAAWDSYIYRPQYRITPSGRRFGPGHSVPTRDDLDGVALDRRGRVHLLLVRFPGDFSQQRLVYLTNASGRWREQQVQAPPCDHVSLPPGCLPAPLLTYDPVTDRLVAVTQFKSVELATKRASARKFGPFRAVAAANKLGLDATSLTAHGGTIALGLESDSGRYPEQGRGPLYAMIGGQLVRVPGTTADDFNLFVAASSRDRVQVAWQRRSATWDLAQQGIWTAEGVRDKKTGHWSIQSISHRTVSHYDHLSSLTVDARGRALAAYIR
jgi:hypothetical protein